jgi:ribose 1,5-bisphosphokinase
VSGRGLFLVVGPSGAGKDSCIDWALEHAPTELALLRARRYCTRPPGPGEQHVPCSERDFALRCQLGCFALRWSANGLHYGIGIEIETWLAAGALVLVNGSRGALSACLERYPAAGVIHVSADATVRAERLARRGREDAAAIAARLRRDPPLELPADARHWRIDNTHDLATAGAHLLCALQDDGGVFTVGSCEFHEASRPLP